MGTGWRKEGLATYRGASTGLRRLFPQWGSLCSWPTSNLPMTCTDPCSKASQLCFEAAGLVVLTARFKSFSTPIITDVVIANNVIPPSRNLLYSTIVETIVRDSFSNLFYHIGNVHKLPK